MTEYTEFKLAAIQATPAYFDLKASTEKACRLIKEAGSKDATIVAFSETWLSGYPFFVWLQPSPEIAYKILADYIANAVEIPGPETDLLCAAAKEANVDVAIGVSERDKNTMGTTYCTLLFISSEGEILGRHRKLKPTDRERTVWGEGDGSSLNVYERPYARISGLNCWEHQMVLPGYALMTQGTQIHIATWPGTSTCGHSYLSAAFAAQAAAYVIDVGGLFSKEAIPEEYRELERVMPGESTIYDPFGNKIAGPAQGETILMAEGSTEVIFAAKTKCDTGGHYSRPDIFQLQINRKPTQRVVYTESDSSKSSKPEEIVEDNSKAGPSD